MTRIAIVAAVSLMTTWSLVGSQAIKNLSTLVTVAGTVVTWTVDPATGRLEKTWESRPFLSRATAEPEIADVDGDGINDLIVVDHYGIAVLGTRPAYYAFPVAYHATRPVKSRVIPGERPGTVVFLTMGNMASVESVASVQALHAWKADAGALVGMPVDAKGLRDSPFVLTTGDATNDGRNDLITAADSISIAEQQSFLTWTPTAALPFPGTIADVVRIADVDADGRNEILAVGNSGMLSIYRHRVSFGGPSYPVVWQSPVLIDEQLPADERRRIPLTQGLAVGDIDGDGRPEILVGTARGGSGRIHVLRHDPTGVGPSFVQIWRSPQTLGADIPAFTIGDFNGDGVNEFVYNGTEVYQHDAKGGHWTRQAVLQQPRQLPGGGSRPVSAAGLLPGLSEPVHAVRIVPTVRITPSASVARGERLTLSVSLRNVWADAQDVSLEVSSPTSDLVVSGGQVSVGRLPGGAEVSTSDVVVHAARSPSAQVGNPDNPTVQRMVTIVVRAQGHLQSIPVRITIQAARGQKTSGR